MLCAPGKRPDSFNYFLSLVYLFLAFILCHLSQTLFFIFDCPFHLGRFKVIVLCSNLEEFGLPSFITMYNGKPVLIRSTGTGYRTENYIEMDINVHKFGSLCRKALEILINNFDKVRYILLIKGLNISTQCINFSFCKQMVIDVGYCLEGRDDDELPEMLLGSASIIKPHPTVSPEWSGVP